LTSPADVGNVCGAAAEYAKYDIAKKKQKKQKKQARARSSFISTSRQLSAASLD
jgi:hypothetical protein